MNTNRSIVFAVSFALATLVPLAAGAASKVTFDNQSGKPALVKVVGPTASTVSVENGKKESLSVATGHYFIKVRYGTAGSYSFSKGDEFEVTETATTASDITITLHKVVAGNYGAKSISESEFGTVEPTQASARTPASTPKTKDTTLDSAGGAAAWADSFAAFMRRLAVIVGDKPQIPPKGGFGVLNAKNDKDEDIWLIPQSYPFPDSPFASSPNTPSTTEFRGKTVRWELTVARIEEVSESGNVAIAFEKPDLTEYHPQFKEFLNFRATVTDAHKQKARSLAVGQKIRLEAKTGFNAFEGVDVFIGVGPNAGTIGVSLLLKEARIL